MSSVYLLDEKPSTQLMMFISPTYMDAQNFLGIDSKVVSRLLHGDFIETPPLVSWPLVCQDFIRPLIGLILYLT